jgi:PKD repeat protein
MKIFTYSRSVVLLLAIGFSTLFTSAQTVYEESIDGLVFFKIKDDVFTKIPMQGDYVEIKKVDFLKNIEHEYSISRVSKAFFLEKMSERSKRVYMLEFDNHSQVDKLVADLKQIGIIEYAERVPLPKLFYSVNDPIYNNTNSGLNYNWHLDKINAQGAWDISTGSSSVKVAIVDNAVWEDHEDLNISSSNLFTVTSYSGAGTSGTAAPPTSVSQTVADIESPGNGYEWSHGTHCAGLIGATTNNSIGVASIGHGVTLMGVRIADNSGELTYTYVGAQWAAENGADVISISYGGTQYSAALEGIYEDIRDNYGCILVGAAGNDGIDEMNYPAAYDCVIAVGMSDYDDQLNYSPAGGGYPESGSNYGSWVDIAAPGGVDGTMFSQGGIGLFSTTYNYNAYEENYVGGYANVTGHYDLMTGTSMATPMAAGVIGLMLSIDPNMTQDDVLSCLQSTADPIQGTHQIASGSGRIDAEAALICVEQSISTVFADFSADETIINLGEIVSFTDESYTTEGSITSHNWTVTPSANTSFVNSTNATSANPQIQFDAAGNYTIALTVSNASESDTETKTNFITVIDPAGPGECDTLIYPLGGSLALYNAQDGDGNYAGYITGTNDWADVAKANFYQNSEAYEISGMVIGIGKASGTSGNIEFAIWEDNSGTPGAILTSTTVPLADLTAQFNTSGYFFTPITFDNPVQITGNFYAGVNNVPNGAAGDTIALISNSEGDTNPGIAWEKWSNGVWYTMVDAWSANFAMAIHPIVCPMTVGDDPYITDVDINNDVEDVTVDYGTSLIVAKLQLANEITIRDSNSGTHQVSVAWTITGYNGNNPGTYNAVGSFDLPDGVVQSDPETELKVYATVTVEEEETDPHITDVDLNDDVENITVPYGTAENTAKSQLAQQITIRDSDSQTHIVNLNWTVNSYNGNVAATYNATGTFSLPNGVVQSSPATDLSVTATITVEEPVGVSVSTEITGLSVYPNPAKDILYIYIDREQHNQLGIYNSIGKCVLLLDDLKEVNTIDISNLSPGVYTISTKDLSHSTRFIIR